MSVLPSAYLELENIYEATFGSGLRCVSISSVNPGEGSTTIAVALAQRNLLSGKSTLIVDMNSFSPGFLPVMDDHLFDLNESVDNTLSKIPEPIPLSTNAYLEKEPEQPRSNLKHSYHKTHRMSPPQLISNTGYEFALTGVLAPCDTQSIIALRQPDTLEKQIDVWFQEYDLIIFDTAPINKVNRQNIPAQRIIKACEGAVIVALAGSTTESDIASSLNKLKKHKNKIVGWVINDRDNPSLQLELLRELKKFEPWLEKYTTILKKIIIKSKFLSTHI